MIRIYFKKAWNSTFIIKSIPSLDGLRAVSILFVIAGHLYLNQNFGPKTKFFIFQDIGVSLFFVISGFLITKILLNEYKLTKKVSLKTFFIKRVFRIFPAYYFYLILIAFYSNFSMANISFNIFMSCFFYFGYYYLGNLPNLVAHSWSLAVEEQFYLLWPIAFRIFKKITNFHIVCIFLIFISPVLRILTYFFIPVYQHKYPFLLHTRIDTLMIGCLYALNSNSIFFIKIKKIATLKKTFFLSLFFLLIINPYLSYLFLGKYRATVGYTFENFLILIVIIHLINVKNSILYKILNSKLFIHLGSISYGLYLWQQPFTFINHDSFLFDFPFNIICIYFCALISYFIIEFPALLIRHKLLSE